MDLLTFIKSLSKADAETFAKRCGTSVGQLKQVAYGNRRASATLAIEIEKSSNKAVPCESLRPDIDWQYLRSSPCVQEMAA